MIIQVASFKLRGKRVFRMAPAPPPLRAVRLGGAEGHRALLDPLDPLRAALALDPEAAMNVPGAAAAVERVLVYGLGLSGRAAARLLLAHGVDGAGRSTTGRADALDSGELAARRALRAASPAACRRRRLARHRRRRRLARRAAGPAAPRRGAAPRPAGASPRSSSPSRSSTVRWSPSPAATARARRRR